MARPDSLIRRIFRPGQDALFSEIISNNGIAMVPPCQVSFCLIGHADRLAGIRAHPAPSPGLERLENLIERGIAARSFFSVNRPILACLPSSQRLVYRSCALCRNQGGCISRRLGRFGQGRRLARACRFGVVFHRVFPSPPCAIIKRSSGIL